MTEIILLIKESLKAFYRNNNFKTSAALAYYGLFAMIPMFLLSIYLLGNYIISSQSAAKELEHLSFLMIPQFNKVIFNEVSVLSQYKNIWEWVSLGVLLWAITPLVSALRESFAAIFNVKKGTAYLKDKLLDVIIVTAILALFIILVISEILYSKIIVLLFKYIPFLLYISNIIMPLILISLFMSVFYFIFAPIKVRYRHLLIGSTITSLIMTLIRPSFTLFLTYNTGFGFTFGSLKAIFVILIWVYCSFSVILFGAEIINCLSKKDTLILKDLFKNQTLKLKLLDRFVETFNEGDIIFKDGTVQNKMYYMLSGEALIQKGEKNLKTINSGEYFGEISMLLDTPRTATVIVTKNDTQVIAIPKKNFIEILSQDSDIVLKFLKDMAGRIKYMDENY
ncbi:MAG: YihY family inner membrane protein [Nitrospirae bacterium]|nr:YihY family inner membrane protein [Nitrospirota bacterium]